MNSESSSHRLSLLGVGVLIALLAVAKAEEPNRKYRTSASIDGWLYTSEVELADVDRTGGDSSAGRIQPSGIGIVAAAERAAEAFANLDIVDQDIWLLHSVTRLRLAGIGWVYSAAFTKRDEKMPDYMGNQLRITVLLDGTVVPVTRAKNGNPVKR